MIDLNTWDDLHFDEPTHTYMVGDKKLTSVTTLIGRYMPRFKADYWATYKVLESMGHHVKPGRKELDELIVDGTPVSSHVARHTMTTHEDVEVLKLEWRDKSDRALEEGTRLHRLAEDVFHGTYTGGADWLRDYIMDQPGSMLASEVKMYHGSIAGTADLLRVVNGNIWIEDYKTDKEIKSENPWENMLAPLHRVQACNLNKYMIQLGAYALLLYESTGVKATRVIIHHIDKDRNTVKPYHLNIRKCTKLARRIFTKHLNT